MILTSIDYQNIANMIEAGCNSIEYTKGNETIFIDYTYTEDGYFEDDYFNGTGGFVVTTRFLSVEDVCSINEDGEDTANDFKEKDLITMVA